MSSSSIKEAPWEPWLACFWLLRYLPHNLRPGHTGNWPLAKPEPAAQQYQPNQHSILKKWDHFQYSTFIRQNNRETLILFTFYEVTHFDFTEFLQQKTLLKLFVYLKIELLNRYFQFQYLGDWYQVQGIPSFFQPADTHCVRATYTRRDDLSINVRNIGIFGSGDKEICGHADSKDEANPAQLKLYFPGTPEGDYWVLDTDYENWSAVYSCGDIFGLIKFEYAFALTRTPHPSAEVVSFPNYCKIAKNAYLNFPSDCSRWQGLHRPRSLFGRVHWCTPTWGLYIRLRNWLWFLNISRIK